MLVDATCLGEKKEKDDQSYWLASRRGLKKYLCVTILSHFSVVTMRICLRYPFVRILETNTQERWVNSIKPVIEKATENFQKWGNVKEQKKKKNLQSKGASLPLTGIAEVNLKESRRITQSTSWHTGNNTSLFNHIMFRDAYYQSLLYKTDNIQDKFTHVTVIEGLLEGWDWL